MSMRLNDPETWKGLWEQALSNGAAGRERADPRAGIERWNSRAHQFADSAMMPASQDRSKELLGWLSQCGALKQGFRVLDIGAGAGRYAIPMAKMGCEVVALEPAEAMIAHMRERMAKEEVASITILHKTWQEADLDRDALRGQFDLVFASMSPGIQAPDDLVKMIGASRLACFLSSHTRDRWRHLERVWEAIHGHALTESPGEFLYRFGLVYSLGYVPLTFYQNGRGARGPVPTPEAIAERVKADIVWSLRGRIGEDGFTDEVNAKIDAYVRSLDMEQEAAAGRSMASQAMLWFVESA